VARRGLVKLSTATGANTGSINLSIAGSVAANAGPVGVYRFAVNPAPAGTRLVAVGNFTTVGTDSRARAFMLTLGATSASVNAWSYPPLQNLCRAGSLPDYLRDVDFSPDGSWFAVVSTGFLPQAGGIGRDLCDATARFKDRRHQPDPAVYVRGHQRWLDNPQGSNAPGPGAVSRPGIGAINPATGLALSWNPTKERGVGGKDLYVTPQGLWVGSDTTASATRPAAGSPSCPSRRPVSRAGRRGGWCVGPWPGSRPRRCRARRRPGPATRRPRRRGRRSHRGRGPGSCWPPRPPRR
jgi:hypothetical protein